jgi:hypothetical protein
VPGALGARHGSARGAIAYESQEVGGGEGGGGYAGDAEREVCGCTIGGRECSGGGSNMRAKQEASCGHVEANETQENVMSASFNGPRDREH